MANFLLLYTGGSGMAETEAEQQAVMAAWGAWMGGLGDSLIDGGAPINPMTAHSIAPDGTVTRAAPAGLQTGYSVISAENAADAVAKAKGCPVLDSGGSISVLETVAM